MLPISPITIGIGALIFLSRSNVGGIIGGGLIAMVLMHLWPDTFMPIYEWVGSMLRSMGIDGMVREVERDIAP